MAESTQFQPILTSNLTATIADGATESNAIDLSGTTLTALVFPAEFDGTALTLEASTTANGSFVDVFEATGAALTIQGGASRITTLEPARLAGLQYIKLVADTSQTGATAITLMTRPV